VAGELTTGEGASLSERLAAYWSRARVEDLPAPVVAMAKRLLLDTLVVGARGGDSEEAGAALRAVRQATGAGRGEAVLWGTPDALPPGPAALVNGTACHALEFDDFGGCGHSGAVVIPAVCAIADASGASGAAVLRAVVAGYDVAGRVLDGAGGYRPHNERGWHSTATCGTFGAAAGAAAILGLDAERFAWALGIAGSYAAGTWAFLADGASTKRLHTGRAAESGVVAAYLAQAGLSGPAAILDAPWGGFFSTYGGECDPPAAVKGLGERFRILDSGIKLYPCCRGLHSSIEAFLELMRRERFSHRDIEAIVVHGADRTVRQFSKRDVATVLDGQFSLPYALAATAVAGAAGLEQFVPLNAADPAIRALMDRVEVRADRPLGPYEEPDVEVRLASGAVLSAHVPIARGAAARPPSDAELLAKHEAIGPPVLGRRRFDELRARIDRLEEVADFRDVSRLLSA
jgi:2-methylcitrate dehydratase PrpD